MDHQNRSYGVHSRISTLEETNDIIVRLKNDNKITTLKLVKSMNFMC